MKKAVSFVLILLTSVTTYAQPSFRVDFSGVDALFEVADQLKQGQDLTDEQWEAFFQTSGYSLLNFDLKGRIQIAFLPGKQKERDSLQSLTDFDFAAYTVNHLQEVDQHRSAIRAYQQKTDVDSLLREAHALVKKFLPSEVNTNASAPTLYFGLFQPDAYAYDTAVFADLYAAMKKGKKAFAETMAHEMHHYYRKQAAPYLSGGYFYDNGGNQYQVLRVINNIHSEGTADVIDKTIPSSGERWSFLQFMPESFNDKYDSSFYATPKTLQKMDSLLILAAQDTGYVSAEINDLLDFGGHPQGFYMSSLIKEELGLAPIINSFYSPVAFIRLYNRAARRRGDSEFVFSEKAMNYLESLEREFFSPSSLPKE